MLKEDYSNSCLNKTSIILFLNLILPVFAKNMCLMTHNLINLIGDQICLVVITRSIK